MTKPNGLETLFYGTAVVVLLCKGHELAHDINQSVQLICAIVLTALMLDYKFGGLNNSFFETSIRADPLHCRATDRTATETRRPLHLFA